MPEKIASLKKRYERVKTSIEEYEACAAEQAAELKRMSVSRGFEDEIEDGDGTDNDGKGDDSQSAMANDGSTTVSDTPPHPLTVDEMRKNEEEIAELERKKRGLEERVTGMEKDLAGVLR